MNITMLGTGLIGRFYTQTIQRGRSADKVTTVYSRTQASADRFAKEYGATLATTDMTAAIGGKVFYPRPEFCTDNGAMIALAAAMRLQSGVQTVSSVYAFDVKPRWPLDAL